MRFLDLWALAIASIPPSQNASIWLLANASNQKTCVRAKQGLESRSSFLLDYASKSGIGGIRLKQELHSNPWTPLFLQGSSRGTVPKIGAEFGLVSSRKIMWGHVLIKHCRVNSSVFLLHLIIAPPIPFDAKSIQICFPLVCESFS